MGTIVILKFPVQSSLHQAKVRFLSETLISKYQSTGNSVIFLQHLLSNTLHVHVYDYFNMTICRYYISKTYLHIQCNDNLHIVNYVPVKLLYVGIRNKNIFLTGDHRILFVYHRTEFDIEWVLRFRGSGISGVFTEGFWEHVPAFSGVQVKWRFVQDSHESQARTKRKTQDATLENVVTHLNKRFFLLNDELQIFCYC